MPKVYKVISGGTTVEKFVLFPDMTGGRLARFKNRSLFFGAEDKINLRLPTLVRDFMKRQAATLTKAVSLFPDHSEKTVEPEAESSAKRWPM